MISPRPSTPAQEAVESAANVLECHLHRVAILAGRLVNYRGECPCGVVGVGQHTEHFLDDRLTLLLLQRLPRLFTTREDGGRMKLDSIGIAGTQPLRNAIQLCGDVVNL